MPDHCFLIHICEVVDKAVLHTVLSNSGPTLILYINLNVVAGAQKAAFILCLCLLSLLFVVETLQGCGFSGDESLHIRTSVRSHTSCKLQKSVYVFIIRPLSVKSGCILHSRFVTAREEGQLIHFSDTHSLPVCPF